MWRECEWNTVSCQQSDAAAGQAGDAVEAADLEGLGQRQVRQNGAGAAISAHRLMYLEVPKSPHWANLCQDGAHKVTHLRFSGSSPS